MAQDKNKFVTYSDSGVNIDEGNASADSYLALIAKARTKRVIDNPDGFGGLFMLDYEQPVFKKKYRKPVLVAGTDGVGTKLRVAFLTGKHDTVGIDLVAMSVNDILTQGAEPLFFLDYFATSKLRKDQAVAVVRGVAAGCRMADCALLGGETAELPGFYHDDEYDLAGFAVGVVEKHKIIDGKAVCAGDKIIGLAASGLHSNGFSLARRVLLDDAKLSLDETPEFLDCALAEELLKPTAIYVKPVLSILSNYRRKRPVHGMAHITGGGIVENLPRVIPKGLGASIRRGEAEDNSGASWQVPGIFRLIQKLGPVEREEMFRVFNMGLGFMLVVSPHFADAILGHLKKLKVKAWIVGEIREGIEGVMFEA
ncbi:MAG: phosphoribosylformylglycinamidine cyclo-ligase [Planctomycetes bacterium]|nr:phosphoribosylformylglycinamidine cyclo-ligase [Planctomycetota bacterium]